MKTALLFSIAFLAILGACAGATSGPSERPMIDGSHALHTIAVGAYWTYVIDPSSESCLLNYKRHGNRVTMAPIDCVALARNHPDAASLITWVQNEPY